MDISPTKTTTTALEDRSWLGSQHGTDETRTITLDAALFTANTHYPNGEIKSGTVLGRKTSTGLYGPYDDAASDGRQVARGYLFNTERVKSGTAHIGAPLLDHGKVRTANLPANSGYDAAAAADLPQIIHL